MIGQPTYSEYHPRWLRRPVSTYWWLQRWAYARFILREISSVFVAWFIVYLLILIGALGRGTESYQHFIRWSAHPIVLALNVITLVFVVFHAITWFNLAPKAMVVHIGKRRVPGAAIAAGNYAGAVIASVLVAWLLLRA
jgi:fumarate reductase subunit C